MQAAKVMTLMFKNLLIIIPLYFLDHCDSIITQLKRHCEVGGRFSYRHRHIVELSAGHDSELFSSMSVIVLAL